MCVSVCLSFCPSVCLSVCPSVCPCVCVCTTTLVCVKMLYSCKLIKLFVFYIFSLPRDTYYDHTQEEHDGRADRSTKQKPKNRKQFIQWKLWNLTYNNPLNILYLCLLTSGRTSVRMSLIAVLKVMVETSGHSLKVVPLNHITLDYHWLSPLKIYSKFVLPN